MPEKSFYDLDYIIEINEQRLEQYNSAIDKLMSRFTIPILIYSAITIFLIPVIQEEIKKLLKASYITEWEDALKNNRLVFNRKRAFYYRALTCALLSVLPYLVCIDFQISQKAK